MGRFGLFCAALTLAACGHDVVLRPLDLEIGGLSGRAQTLVVQIFPGSTSRTCEGLGLGNVKSLSAPYMASWSRDAADRQLAIPDVEDARITIVAHSEDASGTPIQFACAEIEYEDLESPEFQIQLSARM